MRLGQLARSTMRPVRVAILGSTGSIGTQALDVARAMPGAIQVIGLAARSRTEILLEQAAAFRPRYVYGPGLLAAGTPSTDLDAINARCLPMEELVVQEDVDLVLVATVGRAGLSPTLAALRAGKSVAIANKEVLVMAGDLVMATARASGAMVLPVDSEHSAIWQCLRGESADGLHTGPEVARLVLTASGGAFRDRPIGELAKVTPTEALKHPNWTMGPKVTVDSATLLNKGLEVIEAHWLFGTPYTQIDVVLHRESVIHSLVEFVDGSFKAQLGAPDMRAPLQYAFTYPHRLPGPGTRLDLAALGRLTFEPLDPTRYPCFGLARRAADAGGGAPAALAAAADVAVERFLTGAVGFNDIAMLIEETMTAYELTPSPTLEQVLQIDEWARAYCLARSR